MAAWLPGDPSKGAAVRNVVIIEAVRAPIGRRNGGLSTMHSLDLLGAVQRDLFIRTGVDPLEVGQVVGGCVQQTGMQAMNVTRNAWLAAGLPIEVAATTVDSQCGSSQQATTLAYSLIASGVVDVAVACGVEIMSRIPTGATPRMERDEGIRETTVEGLAALKPTGRPDGVHTAGSSSQIADGAGAVLMMTREKADALGLQPKATVVDVCLVGSDPTLMLTGPIPATRKLLDGNKLTVDDIDVFEINEAFASVVLAWERELKPDRARVNPNGGAIAIGHPLGGTGAILVTKAVHELERSDTEHALVTMCCGGGLGTGTLIRRG